MKIKFFSSAHSFSSFSSFPSFLSFFSFFSFFSFIHIIVISFFLILFSSLFSSVFSSFSPLFFVSSTFAIQDEIVDEYDIDDHRLEMKNLYFLAYGTLTGLGEKEKPLLERKAISAAAKGLGVTSEQLEAMILGNEGAQKKYCQNENSQECIMRLLQNFCPNDYVLQEKFIECQKMLERRIAEEYEIAQFEDGMRNYAKSSQAFANGTLQDTGAKSFDIIVDLNIIDLILFGNKMTIPKTGSPFLPTFPFSNDKKNGQNTNPDEDNDYDDNSDFNDGWEQDNPNDNNDDEENENFGENTDESNGEYETEGFCMDPDSTLFSEEITKQFLGIHQNETETEENSGNGNGGGNENNTDYGAVQMGNIVPEYIKYSGGIYPDIRSLGGTKKCGDGEKSYFQGRVCIPEFCTELICIKINFEMEKDRLQKLDCVECHIDRGNEALNPFVATLGQNTPNQNPQESFFLSAFANLFKGVTKSITLKPKRLPFLIYDQALSDQKKEKDAKKLASQSPQQPEENKKKEKEFELPQFSVNKKLYDEMLLNDCPELIQNFKPGESYLIQQNEYCKMVEKEKNLLSGSAQAKNKYSPFANNEIEQKAKGRSDTYRTVVQPFFLNMSKDMQLVNQHLFDIIPKTIQKTSQNCKQVIH